jgi:hypothetical protein
MSQHDSLSSKQMRTFSFDGEGIYEMPEGVGEYVLASEARAEIERLRAICAAAYQMAGAYDAPVRFLDALALHDEYLEMTPDQIIDALLPAESPDETADAIVGWMDTKNGDKGRLCTESIGLKQARIKRRKPQESNHD